MFSVPRHFRVKRLTMGKLGVKHSSTLLTNTGPDGPPKIYTMLETSGGPRSTTGGHQTIQSSASTDENCRTGDLIKYVNVHIQIAPRGSTDNQNGWLEYAYVLKKESDIDIPSTNLGAQTLGDIATSMYRGDCIWTGFIPTGKNYGNGVELSIKIPKSKQYMRLGDTHTLYMQFRSQDSAATGGNFIRLIASFNAKVYS